MSDHDDQYVQAWIKRAGPLTLYVGRVRGKWHVTLWLRAISRIYELKWTP